MRHRPLSLITTCSLAALIGSCGAFGPEFSGPPVQTQVSLINFSKAKYAFFSIREHRSQSEEPAEFFHTPLLPPGGLFRADFNDVLGTGCPANIDLRVFHYRRVNEDVPIGEDPGEVVNPTPVFAKQIDNINVCPPRLTSLEVLTVTNYETPDGVARLEFARGSLRGFVQPLETDPMMTAEPPALAEFEPIRGQVVLRSRYTGVPDVLVVMRPRFREQDAVGCLTLENIDLCFSDPIQYTVTDGEGGFLLDRPPGGYLFEFYSDDFDLRPSVLALETPINIIRVIAESITP